MPNFTVVALKMQAYRFKFAPKGYVPLSNFYKISDGEGLPGPPLCQISLLSL